MFRAEKRRPADYCYAAESRQRKEAITPIFLGLSLHSLSMRANPALGYNRFRERIWHCANLSSTDQGWPRKVDYWPTGRLERALSTGLLWLSRQDRQVQLLRDVQDCVQIGIVVRASFVPRFLLNSFLRWRYSFLRWQCFLRLFRPKELRFWRHRTDFLVPALASIDFAPRPPT
jgi:hypothetical protein